jgi:ABC-type Na+ efflux pump permease subunit
VTFALATLAKDVRRRLRDPMSILLWLGIPVAIAGMLRLAFGGHGGSTPVAKVLVVDQDDTFLSGLLLGALSGDRGPEMPFAAEAVDEAQGRARIDDGDASALLVIPAGFSDALLSEEPCTLELVTNPAQRILPGMVEEALSMLIDASFYLHRIFGEPLRAMAVEPPEGRETLPSEEVARISVQINDLMERVLVHLTPPVIQVAVEEAAEERDDGGGGFAQLFFPSMLFMTLFFLAQGMSEDLWVEKDAGTLRRALVTPNRASGLVAGKLAAALVFVALVSLAGMLFGSAAFGIRVANLPLAVLWATASGAMLVLLLYLLQLFASSQRGGNLLSTLVMMPLLMLGGSFFPFEAMPDGMAALGRLTPNGWALTELKAILDGAVDPARLTRAFGGLAVVCAVLFLVTTRRIAGAFARS